MATLAAEYVCSITKVFISAIVVQMYLSTPTNPFGNDPILQQLGKFGLGTATGSAAHWQAATATGTCQPEWAATGSAAVLQWQWQAYFSKLLNSLSGYQINLTTAMYTCIA